MWGIEIRRKKRQYMRICLPNVSLWLLARALGWAGGMDPLAGVVSRPSGTAGDSPLGFRKSHWAPGFCK